MELKFDPNQPLDLTICLMMGQAFRWRKEGEWFSGVVKGNFIKVRKISDGILEFHGKPGPDDHIGNLLRSYLRLDEDIEAIYAEISSRDSKIAELVHKYRGLRILRQEPWECLVAYICSATAPIGLIRQNVENLAEKLGAPISFDDETRYSFPTQAQLVETNLGELKRLMVGLPVLPSRIHQVTQRAVAGDLELDALKRMPYPDAKRELKKSDGIGHKIDDCVLLFSMDKLEAFPIDTHIRKALLEWYFPDLKPLASRRLREHELRKLQVKGQERFGKYAGYAGQFLFHGMRMGE